MIVMTVIWFTFAIWDTSLNFWRSALWMCVTHYKISGDHHRCKIVWLFKPNSKMFSSALQNAARSVHVVTNVFLSDSDRAFFVDIPQLDMSKSKTHYEMLLCPWVWIRHVTGVCVSVFKCALIIERMSPVYPVKWNCIETGDRVSHERRSDTDRPQQRADMPPSDAHSALPF